MSQILAMVQADLAAREAKGLEKYKHTVDRTDLPEEQWLQHMYEELLDGAMYAKRRLVGLAKAREGITP